MENFKDLKNIIRNILVANDFEINSCEITDAFVSEQLEFSVAKNDKQFGIQIYVGSEDFPLFINYYNINEQSEDIFNLIKKTLEDKDFTTDRYGLTLEKDMFLRFTKDNDIYNLYIDLYKK